MNTTTNDGAATKPTDRWAGATLYGPISMSPAPCRMIAVEVYRMTRGDHHVRWTPVVGILSIVETGYIKDGRPEDNPDPPATHEGLVEDGYNPDLQMIGLRPIAVDGEYTLLDLGPLDEHNLVKRAIVPCHWPPDRDREEAVRIGRELLADTYWQGRWAPLDPPVATPGKGATP
jgi:hypothetical protein